MFDSRLLAILFFSFCFSIRQPLAQEPIRLGAVFALTGLGASQGNLELKAVNLAVDEINAAGGIGNRPIELIVEDVSLDKLNRAPAAIQKLITIDKVIAIIGPTWDEPAQAILPILETNKIPTIGPNQTESVDPGNKFKYFFSTWPRSTIGVKALLSEAKRSGVKKISIIRPIPAGFYEYVSRAAAEVAQSLGLEILETVDLGDPTATDFRTALTKIKSKKPDAILAVLNGTTVCPLLRQSRELGLELPVLTTEAAADSGAAGECAFEMKRLVISLPAASGRAPAFYERFKARYDERPETPSALTAYDATRIMAQALSASRGRGGQELQRMLEFTDFREGVSSDQIKFDSAGFVVTSDSAYRVMTNFTGRIDG